MVLSVLFPNLTIHFFLCGQKQFLKALKPSLGVEHLDYDKFFLLEISKWALGVGMHFLSSPQHCV